MTHSKTWCILISPVLCLLLSSCGVSSISTIEDLKNAYVKAGFECEENGEADLKSELIERGLVARYECGTATLTLMDSRQSLLEFVWGSRSRFIGVSIGVGVDYSEFDLYWAVRERWYIADDDIADIQSVAETLGADVYSMKDGKNWAPIIDEIKTSVGDDYFEALKNMCGSSDNSYGGIRVSNDGGSLTINTKGKKDSSGASLYDAFCFLAAVDAPEYIYDLVKTTRALDGTREERWGDIRASWSYHPDDGLDLILISEPK
jgi:hypothetical protein